MAKLVGTVTNISEQKVATNGNRYSTVETTIGSFNVFDTGFLMKLESDKEYMIEYEQKGKFKNLVGFEPVNPRANDALLGRTSYADKQSDFAPLGEFINKEVSGLRRNDVGSQDDITKLDERRRIDCLSLVVDLITNCPATLNNVFLSNDNVELSLKIAHAADVLNHYLRNGRDEEMRAAQQSLSAPPQQSKNPEAPEAAFQAGTTQSVVPENGEQEEMEI